MHVPVSETPQWDALTAHVAEIDKTCARAPGVTCTMLAWGQPHVSDVQPAVPSPAVGTCKLAHLICDQDRPWILVGSTQMHAAGILHGRVSCQRYLCAQTPARPAAG